MVRLIDTLRPPRNGSNAEMAAYHLRMAAWYHSQNTLTQRDFQNGIARGLNENWPAWYRLVRTFVLEVNSIYAIMGRQAAPSHDEPPSAA